MCVCVCTQRDLFPGVGGQQEDEQRQARDEHTRDEQVEAVIQRPSPDGYGVGHVGVRLLTTLVIQFITLPRDPCGHTHTQL